MEVREIRTIPELEKVQKLEKAIWGTPPLPIHQTLTAIKNGGIIVGAYDGEQLIGFSYGFAGFKDGEIYLTSHMLGIVDHYRSQGIGEALKQTQRKIAIERGYNRMIWTYDPLQTRNGYLNLTKLHAICDTYIENCYGEMKDGLNKGLPSDRFEVNWYLTSQYVVKNTITAKLESIVDYKLNGEGFPVLMENPNLTFDNDAYLMPVPHNFQNMKIQDPQLALDWRLKSRTIFQQLFAHGFVAIKLEKGKEVHQYLFVKKESLCLESGGSQ